MEQMDDVIAIGSPTGDYDSLVSGMVTSVTGNMKLRMKNMNAYNKYGRK